MSELSSAAAENPGTNPGGGAPGGDGGGNGGAPAGGGASGAGGGTSANAGGAGSPSGPSWLDNLSPEYRNDNSLKGFKSADDLAKSYLHAQKFIGADKIPIPGKNATEDDWNNVYTKLGRPEAADKYELKLPEGQKPEEFKAAMEAAHKAGLNSRQLQAMFDYQQQANKQAVEAQQERYKQMVNAGIEKLKQEWPDNTYKENLQKAFQATKGFFGQDVLEWADKSGVGNDPTFIKMMHKVAIAMGEDTLRGAGGTSFGESRESIQSKIDSHYSDLNGPYLNANHPGHEKAQAEVSQLFEMLNKNR